MIWKLTLSLTVFLFHATQCIYMKLPARLNSQNCGTSSSTCSPSQALSQFYRCSSLMPREFSSFDMRANFSSLLKTFFFSSFCSDYESLEVCCASVIWVVICCYVGNLGFSSDTFYLLFGRLAVISPEVRISSSPPGMSSDMSESSDSFSTWADVRFWPISLLWSTYLSGSIVSIVVWLSPFSSTLPLKFAT